MSSQCYSFKNIVQQRKAKNKQHCKSTSTLSDLSQIVNKDQRDYKDSRRLSKKQILYAQRLKIPKTQNIELLGQYQKILKQTIRHAKESQHQMLFQIKRHDQYYNFLHRILRNFEEQSRSFLKNMLNEIEEAYNKRIEIINQKIINLCCPSTPVPIFRQLKQLKNLKTIKIDLAKLQFPINQKKIYEQIKKLTFGSFQDQSLIEIVNNSTKGQQQIIQTLDLYQLTCKQNFNFEYQNQNQGQQYINIKINNKESHFNSQKYNKQNKFKFNHFPIILSHKIKQKNNHDYSIQIQKQIQMKKQIEMLFNKNNILQQSYIILEAPQFSQENSQCEYECEYECKCK